MKLTGISGKIAVRLLRCLARLIPSAEREDWCAEWQGEAFYVLRRRRGGRAFLFTLGALQDAVWLSWDAVQAAIRKQLQLRRRSWIVCLGTLVMLLALTCALSRVKAGFAQAPFANLYDIDVDASLWNVALQLLMACATLPALTALNIGSSFTCHSIHGHSADARFCSFLLLKTALVMITCVFLGLAAAHISESVTILSETPEIYRAIRDGLIPVQFLATFSSCLFGLRWVIDDQRHRCRVCLIDLRCLKAQA